MMNLTPEQLLEECKELAFTVHVLTKYINQLEQKLESNNGG